MAGTPDPLTGEKGATAGPRSLVDTWTEVFADAGGLVRAEAALARAETEHNLRTLGRESAKVVAGGMLALMALVFLTIAAVVALAEFIGLLLALLVVAVLCMGGAWALISNGLGGVSGQPILPDRALRRMSRDLGAMADRVPAPDLPAPDLPAPDLPATGPAAGAAATGDVREAA